MKKIIFFSLEDGWLGGVASVNLALEDALRQRGHKVSHLFLRGCLFPLKEKENAVTLRKNCPWDLPTGQDVKAALKEKKIIKALRLLFSRLQNEIRGFIDKIKAKRYLEKEAPDCLVVSSYLLLPFVPKSLYPVTLHHVHTSFDATMNQGANKKTLEKFNGKIGFLWLSRAICEKAKKHGFAHSFFAYNPLSFYPEKRCEAEAKKNVTVITRFSAEKRLPLAINLLKEALDRLPDPNAFTVSFFGAGPEEKAMEEAIGSDPRFLLCGQTKEPFRQWEKARFSINTSLYEGFSISVLESAAAGVPTLSFLFGEAAEEEILSEKTGILVPMDDKEAFVDSLVRLFTDDALVKSLSEEARVFSLRFQKDSIGEDWEALLSRLPLDKKGIS